MHNFWGGVLEAVAQRHRLRCAGGAAKVDERPPVLPRQPHDVGELEVAVDKAGRVQVHEPLRHMLENLHTAEDVHALGLGSASDSLGL